MTTNGTKRVRTIVVDDSPAALDVICRSLNCYDCVDVIATGMCGVAVLELARSHQPELVLIDFQMPGMNGLEATCLLLQEFPNTLVAIVTMHDTPQLREASLASGARWCITKQHLSKEISTVVLEASQFSAGSLPA